MRRCLVRFNARYDFRRRRSVVFLPLCQGIMQELPGKFKSNHEELYLKSSTSLLSRRPVGINGRPVCISWYEAGRIGEGKKLLESE